MHLFYVQPVIWQNCECTDDDATTAQTAHRTFRNMTKMFQFLDITLTRQWYMRFLWLEHFELEAGKYITALSDVGKQQITANENYSSSV